MWIQADPNLLRYASSRFQNAAQQVHDCAIRYQRTCIELHQGSESWTGKGAEASRRITDKISADLQKTSDAFRRVGHTLQTLANRMEFVNRLRHEAQTLERTLWDLRIETPGDQERAVEIRQRMRHAQHQADLEAQDADRDASFAFQEITASVDDLNLVRVPDKDLLKETMSTILDILPLVGNLKSAQEAITGKDLLTGRDLNWQERLVAGAGIILGGTAKVGAKVLLKATLKNRRLLPARTAGHLLTNRSTHFLTEYLSKKAQK